MTRWRKTKKRADNPCCLMAHGLSALRLAQNIFDCSASDLSTLKILERVIPNGRSGQDRGAFSGAVGTEQSEYRSALYRKIQMIDHGFSGIDFRQPFNKHSLAHF